MRVALACKGPREGRSRGLGPLGAVALGLLAATALTAAQSCGHEPATIVVHTASGKQVRIKAEIADTPEKRRTGLMYRRELGEGRGMLFVFPHEEPLTFWMKNTPLSLDIIFIGAARKVVHVVEHARPYSEKQLPSKQPARFVLEVPAGFCKRQGIAVDDRVDLELPGGRLEPR